MANQLETRYIEEQGLRFYPITHRKAIVGLSTNTLVLSESVDIDIDINADGEPITINPIVKQELVTLTQDLTNLTQSTTTSINNINTTLLTKADSDSNGVAHKAAKLNTPRNITISGSVTGSVAFDGSQNVTINVSTNHSHSYAGSSSAGGAANSALRLTNTRNIALNGVVTGNVNFDGSGNVSIWTSFGNSSNYLPLSGGTVNGNIGVNGRYHQNGTVGCIVAVQSGSPNGNMLWAW